MARPLPIPPPGFDELSADEKLAYIQSLWDYVAARPEDAPVPEWHLQLVRERVAEYEADPEAGNLSLEEFFQILDESLSSSRR